MNWLDYAVLGVFAVSTLVGGWRGLVRTVMSLAGWVIALLAAKLLAGPLGELMPARIPTPELRVAAAFVAVFLGTLLVCALVGWLLSRIVKAVGLEMLDTALGTVLGGLRGALILLAAATLAGLTSAPRQPYWKESASGPLAARAVGALRPLLPETLARALRYD